MASAQRSSASYVFIIHPFSSDRTAPTIVLAPIVFGSIRPRDSTDDDGPAINPYWLPAPAPRAAERDSAGHARIVIGDREVSDDLIEVVGNPYRAMQLPVASVGWLPTIVISAPR